ncbi:MAG: pantoate--beta-alanine ligase [Acidobacteriia bacterium]|nr:pantoate--beta-alanine ligase [Terriglobia bacterium]
MEIINRVSRMSAISAKLISSDVQIGLVTTMGVIHPGHLSLIEAAREMTDLVVVSIFVSRLQFLSNEEYLEYPRDITKDVDLLSQQNVDYVFSPAEEEMFPRDFSTYVQVEKFGEKLPGIQQPAYFRGMTTTILKMIHIVRPSFLFLGLKDALQGAILRKMVKDLNLGTEVVITPVARHPSGLAYGTRNYFLTEAEKAAAPVIYRSLRAAEEAIARGERQAKKLINEIMRVIGSEPMARLEYAFVADPVSLEPMSKLQGTVLIGVGARIGATSLNDSLLAEIPAV